MKRLTCLLILLVLCKNIFAQCTVPNCAVTLSTQSQIDQFIISHPSENVIGSIFIEGSVVDPITNLNGLSHIKEISETLSIRDINVTNLSGLQNLTVVKDWLYIVSVPITNLDELSNLTVIGRLVLWLNINLTDLKGLEGAEILRFIHIEGNVKLSNCAVTPICEYLNDPDNMFVYRIKDNLAGCMGGGQIISRCRAAELPVELVSFTVRGENEVSQLSWSTTSESNSKSFEIYRSKDAKKWSIIGTVNSVVESVTKKNYHFLDSIPEYGQNYYRLKMIDQDHTFSYSKIVTVNFSKNSIIDVYPNPASDFIYIAEGSHDTIAQVDVVDLKGNVIFRSKNFIGRVSVANIKNGMYVLKITKKNGTVASNKILVAK
jgi:hypothetical protein